MIVSTLDFEQFHERSALHVPGLLDDSAVEALRVALAPLPMTDNHRMLPGVPALRELVGSEGALGRLAAQLLGTSATPVGMRFLDKVPGDNWVSHWHQDLAAGKDQMAGMVTIRLHLDDVDADNAPLFYAPGSHRFGWLRAAAVPDVVERCGMALCLARAGDAWAYPTLFLHGSDPARRPRRRRVLHVDFAPMEMGMDGGGWSDP